MTSVKLRRIATAANGAGFPHSYQGQNSGDLPFFKVSDFHLPGNGRYLKKCTNWVSRGDAVALGARVVPQNSILLPKVGAALLGNARRITTRPSLFDNNVLALVPRTGDSRYLHYWTTTKDAGELSYPGPVPSLTGSEFLDLTVPISSLVEQRAIADFLDAETARIDALIEKKRRMIELSDERFAAHVEERTHASAVSTQEGGSLPDGWRSVLLRRCFKLIQYGIGEATRVEGTTAVLGMGNVDRGEIVGNAGGFVEEVDPSLLLEPGDLLFNRTNSLALVAKVALVRTNTVNTATTFASYLVRLRTNHLANSSYLNYLLNTKAVLGHARSMALPSIGQANLNPSRYTSMRVPIPPVQIQRSIVRELDSEAANRRMLSKALTRQIELLTEHRQALITDAVTGQLDVPGIIS